MNPFDLEAGAGQMTDRIEQAAILSRRDPLRRGNVVHLPPKGDAVVLGDLHGDRDNFERVVEWAGLHRHRDRYLIVQEVIHGGPRDEAGGDRSFQLLERVAELKCRYKSQVQMILSNHDLAEVNGAEIRKSDRSLSEAFWQGIRNAYGAAWEEVLAAYRRLLGSSPLAVATPNGVFISHSTPQREAIDGFDFGVFARPLAQADFLPGGSVHELVWGRHHDQRSADRFAEAVGARLLVTGHQSSMPGVKTPTTRHIVLVSDGPLGRVMVLPLASRVVHGPLARQVMKIRSLKAAPPRGEGRPGPNRGG